MMEAYSPPETYQQWLACFQHLQLHPLDSKMLETMAQGSYLGKPAESFLVRLSETVGIVITGYCRRFLRQVDLALEDGEPDMVELLAVRLKRDIRKCFFYRSVSFLDSGYIHTLDTGFGDQLSAFWNQLLKELKKTAKDSANEELEDVYLALKRMKFLEQEHRSE